MSLLQRGNMGTGTEGGETGTGTEGGEYESTQREGSHLQAKERGLEHIRLPSDGVSPAGPWF